jgi:hypothetical protein
VHQLIEAKTGQGPTDPEKQKNEKEYFCKEYQNS